MRHVRRRGRRMVDKISYRFLDHPIEREARRRAGHIRLPAFPAMFGSTTACRSVLAKVAELRGGERRRRTRRARKPSTSPRRSTAPLE